MKQVILSLFMVVLLAALIAVGGLLYLAHWGGQPMQLQETRLVEVESGSSFYRLSQQLEQQSLIGSGRLFRLYGRLHGLSSVIHAGEYELVPGMTPADLYRNLVNGTVVQYAVTLVDGQTLASFRNALQQSPKLISTLDRVDLAEVVRSWGESRTNPEGLFYPDTYVFRRGDTDVSILQRAYLRMQQQLEEAWAGRDANLPFQSSYEALILASIVEKETGIAEERPLIAGVFINRLRRNMRLQTDATVIYGMGEQYKGRIRKVHLQTYTPYNTYRIDGLPPTPIANPGRAALDAVLHPAQTEALYFVARGDGSHQFSVTLEEHQAAVRQYQLQRRADYRSSPSR